MDTALSDELSRILGCGIPLAIVTGRGRSAHAQIRDVIPRKFWDRITLGLYNGAYVMCLSEDTDAITTSPSDLNYLQKPLLRLSEVIPIDINVKKYQISVRVGLGLGVEMARAAIDETLKTVDPNVQVRASAHSIDVFPHRVSKVLAVNCLEEQLIPPVSDDAIVRIGDKGALLGNDFELLNSGLSLSCGDVSGKLDACWYLGPRGAVGPTATLAYLRALYCDSNGLLTFDVKGLLRVR